LREGKNFFIYRNFYEEFERYVKKALQTGTSVHRDLVGTPGKGSFTGTCERKRKCVSGFLFLDPEDIKR